MFKVNLIYSSSTILRNIKFNTSHMPYPCIYGFDTQTCARVMCPSLPRKLLRDFISLWIQRSENFSPTLFHSAYNKLMLHPKMGKQRNHGRAVIHRWPPQCTDASSNAFYNYTHDDLASYIVHCHRHLEPPPSHLKSKRINGNDAIHKFRATTAY